MYTTMLLDSKSQVTTIQGYPANLENIKKHNRTNQKIRRKIYPKYMGTQIPNN